MRIFIVFSLVFFILRRVLVASITILFPFINQFKNNHELPEFSLFDLHSPDLDISVLMFLAVARKSPLSFSLK